MERDSQFSVHVHEEGKHYLLHGDQALWMLTHASNDDEWLVAKTGTMSNHTLQNAEEKLKPLEIKGTFDECYDSLRLYLLMNS